MSAYSSHILKELEAHSQNRLSTWHSHDMTLVKHLSEILLMGGRAIVTPTKVGYIVMTIDCAGLEKKFLMKGRPKTKPGVVLCANLEQLKTLAVVDEKILQLYHACWEKGILLGCILPWKQHAQEQYIPQDGSLEMMQDKNGTSCFVIKYGDPSERIVENLWDQHKRLAFASSANPSGKGNRGKLENVGERILDQADFLVFADQYVEAQQPGKSTENRWEQGVMVSMVDATGKLKETPTVIRRGLALEQIMLELSNIYDFFEYKHGTYH